MSLISKFIRIDPFASVLYADTATMGAAMVRDTTGPIRELCHQGHVLLYGSGQDQASDQKHDGNPTGFRGIVASSEGVSAADNTVKLRLHIGNNASGGFRLENERYSEPSNDKYVLAAEPIRSFYATFSLTGQLMQAAANGEKDFKPAFQESMDRLALSSRGHVNNAAFGNGSGVRATLRNNEAAGQTVIDVDTTIYFRTGEIVDGLTIATGVVIEPARTVTDVDRANRTITVSPALTTGLTATTDGWVPASSSSTVAAPNNSWNREIAGLSKLVAATGTVHGISPTLYPLWKSYVASSVGPISDDSLRLAKDTVGFETGLDESGMEFALVTTRGIRSNYADTQLPLKRHVNTQKLQGGFDAIMFDENPIFVDDACQPGRVYGLRIPKLLWATMKDWSWMDADGAVLSRVPGRDQYQAVLYTYVQLMTTERGAHFLLTGVDDTVR